MKAAAGLGARPLSDSWDHVLTLVESELGEGDRRGGEEPEAGGGEPEAGGGEGPEAGGGGPSESRPSMSVRMAKIEIALHRMGGALKEGFTMLLAADREDSAKEQPPSPKEQPPSPDFDSPGHQAGAPGLLGKLDGDTPPEPAGESQDVVIGTPSPMDLQINRLVTAFESGLQYESSLENRNRFRRQLELAENDIRWSKHDDWVAVRSVDRQGYHVLPNPFTMRRTQFGPLVRFFSPKLDAGTVRSSYRVVRPAWLQAEELEQARFDLGNVEHAWEATGRLGQLAQSDGEQP